MIASAAEVNGCVVTDNDKDFYGIEAINPGTGRPGISIPRGMQLDGAA